MRVLVIGAPGPGTVACFFSNALRKLQVEHRFVEADYGHRRPSLIYRLASRAIGKRPLDFWKTNRLIRETAVQFQPDAVLIPKGAWITPETLSFVHASTTAKLINYATDDPFNEAVSSSYLKQSIPLYDVYACTKRAILDDVRRAGCRGVIYVPFAYDPQTHFREAPKTQEERDRFASDVVFVGAADLDRRPMMRSLAKSLEGRWKLRLFGGFWNRDLTLRKYDGGFAVDRDYRLALSATKVALGLVRRANRDGHAMRAFEIPACATFMLAERTEEHLEFFDEGRHIACFGSDEELIDKVLYYLQHDSERQRIAMQGFDRVSGKRHTYEDRVRHLLEFV